MKILQGAVLLARSRTEGAARDEEKQPDAKLAL
jgi:hypothetical protein